MKTAIVRKARIYKGVVVFPADGNASGIRWTARTGNGVALRSQTLAGIKNLIRESKK